LLPDQQNSNSALTRHGTPTCLGLSADTAQLVADTLIDNYPGIIVDTQCITLDTLKLLGGGLSRRSISTCLGLSADTAQLVADTMIDNYPGIIVDTQCITLVTLKLLGQGTSLASTPFSF
jgi:hypothetical protein